MTRDEHLAWCKERAFAYADKGDLSSAVASMGSDLSKHDETKGFLNHRHLMHDGILAAVHEDVAAVKRWIEGFQ